MKRELRKVAVIAAGLGALAWSGVAEAACCRRRCTVKPAYHRTITCRTTENKTAENGGRMGVVSPRKGPDSFLGQKFGDRWPETVDAKLAERGVPFKPKARFRDFDDCSVVLANGRIKEVFMERDCGSKEAADAEIAACMKIMREKYECEFTGTGSARKAVCTTVYRGSPTDYGGSRMRERPEMEIEIRQRMKGVVRITARSLNASLFARDVRPVSKKDADAL